MVFGVTPFGALGDDGISTGNAFLTVLAVAGVFLACWAVASFFLVLHLRQRSTHDD